MVLLKSDGRVEVIDNIEFDVGLIDSAENALVTLYVAEEIGDRVGDNFESVIVRCIVENALHLSTVCLSII